MAEENGEKKGTGLIDRVRQDVTDLKETIKVKGKEELEGLKEPEKTQVFRSIFRVKHDETPRNRALSVLSNVFFHLHPAKVNRDAGIRQIVGVVDLEPVPVVVPHIQRRGGCRLDGKVRVQGGNVRARRRQGRAVIGDARVPDRARPGRLRERVRREPRD